MEWFEFRKRAHKSLEIMIQRFGYFCANISKYDEESTTDIWLDNHFRPS